MAAKKMVHFYDAEALNARLGTDKKGESFLVVEGEDSVAWIRLAAAERLRDLLTNLLTVVEEDPIQAEKAAQQAEEEDKS
jgi:hypothetical protein